VDKLADKAFFICHTDLNYPGIGSSPASLRPTPLFFEAKATE